VTEAELRAGMQRDPAPREADAGERTWQVVRQAYASRERLPWMERHSRVVVIFALLAALAVAAVSPPGRALVDKVRDRVGRETPAAKPALVHLPAGGRLLVDSPHGPWVVHADGSKRLLGAYDAASWSPHGLFVVATRDRQVVALEPDGDVRWTLSRPGKVAQARWAPSGIRIAYREGATLRVVIGNGEGDRLLAGDVAPVAPAWRPVTARNPLTARNQLAYVDHSGRIHVIAVDTREELLSVPTHRSVEKLLWAERGHRLIVLSSRPADLDRHEGGIRVVGTPSLPAGHRLLDGAILADGYFVFADYDPKADKTALIQQACVTSDPCLAIGPVRLFQGDGRLENLVVSPDRHWLYFGWPAPDQAIFLRTPGVRRLVTVSNIAEEFDPGGIGPAEFPHVAGWVPDAR
jgi:hypothetical protein